MSSSPASENPTSENPTKDLSPSASVSADELLPPIEPPSGGFILQLFVIPAVIVLVVMLFGLLFTTLATQGEQDPLKIVAALRSSNQARWQKADELANMLRPGMEQRYPELKFNSELATELAKLLDEQVDEGLDDKNSISLRYYLCRVLGEFNVDEGVDVLLKTAREDQERDVRREAINALAVLSSAFGELDPPKSIEHPQLVETFTALANDEDDLLRSQTAFALGVFAMSPDADPLLMSELELLVDDLYSDARYNAALGLARQGNLKAVAAVTEMFDTEALAMNIKSETSPALQRFKRDTILDNALDAARLLIEKNPDADLAKLRTAVKQFAESAADWQPAPAPKSLVKRARELVAE
ncbi:MAG: HEAT repeat domain-containing protein [Planctomycetes bacterium]|nr:HEAT repeat domain-containing protein [Planctomycetota bacterium]